MNRTSIINNYEAHLQELSVKELQWGVLDSQLWIGYSRELPSINKRYGISSSVKQSFAHLLKIKPDLENDFITWNRLQIEVKQLERLCCVYKRRLDQ